MVDIVLLSLPKLQLNSPLLALAQLKAQIENNNFTCKTFDFNRWLYENTKETILEHIWNDLDNTLFDENLLSEKADHIRLFVDKFIITHIAPLKPKKVGLTAFSFFTFPMLEMFCESLRDLYECEIVIGGPALTSSQKQNKDYVSYLKEKDLIDDFISGDADISIVKYLKNEQYPGINNYDFDNDFDRNELPFPDYSDFELEKYSQIHLSGSRGCVRKCAFCNVPLLWPKFSSKTGKRIADEIIYYYENHNQNNFYMVDSLVNGNQKVFLDFITRLSKYRIENKADIRWSGQFIVRPKNQVPEDVFEKIKDSGIDNFLLGVESGSEKVRTELRKPFNNSDLFYHLELFSKYNIRVEPLMFVGFPTETDEDFKLTIDILHQFKKYKCIERVSCEHPMLVIPGTPVHMDMKTFNINHYEDYFKWTSKDNTYQQRIERFVKFTDECIKLELKHKWHTGISNIFVDFYINNVENKDEETMEIIERVFL